MCITHNACATLWRNSSSRCESAKLSFAVLRYAHASQLRGYRNFNLSFNFPLEHTRVAGKCASKRRKENSGRNSRFVGKGAMSRGTFRSEWQYALGLITRNYWHLSLDIRHTCVPTIKAARAASLGAFHRFQFRIALWTWGHALISIVSVSLRLRKRYYSIHVGNNDKNDLILFSL